jgi:hypothetical protein
MNAIMVSSCKKQQKDKQPKVQTSMEEVTTSSLKVNPRSLADQSMKPAEAP